jgi:hypothetical protein
MKPFGGAVWEYYIGFLKPNGYEQTIANKIVKRMGKNTPNTCNIHLYRAPTSTTQTLYGSSGYAQRIWSYGQSRIDKLGIAYGSLFGTLGKVKISLIYSMEPAFSGPWFAANNGISMDDVHNEVINRFNAASFPGKPYVEIVGYTIFMQTDARTYVP